MPRDVRILALPQPMASLVVWGFRQFTIHEPDIRPHIQHRLMPDDPVLIYADPLSDDERTKWADLGGRGMYLEQWQKRHGFPDLSDLPSGSIVGCVWFGGLAKIEHIYRSLGTRDFVTDDWMEDGKSDIRWRNPEYLIEPEPARPPARPFIVADDVMEALRHDSSRYKPGVRPIVVPHGY
jgi:hypothetical protein